MVQERRGLGAPQQPCQPDLGRRGGQQVLATNDQVDLLADVVHDDTESIRPVVVAIPDGQIACHCDRAGAQPE
jgi:hypothetical protein